MSTGQAQGKAERLAERLQKRGLKVELRGTEHPGHAETIAYETCQKYVRPLIISSSGDGGYNEVVNGIMRAKAEDPDRMPVCAILPAGNSNDNRRSVRKRPLTWAITHSAPEDMDLLQLTVSHQGNDEIRYAHSYIGAGITSHAAAQLNAEELGPIKEVMVVARAIFSFHPVALIDMDGRTKSFDSLIFANIHHMSKVLRTGRKTDINNGMFRVSAIPHRSNFWLFRILLNLLLFIFGLVNLPQKEVYTFSVPQTETIQLDGEVMNLPGTAQVQVTIKPAAVPAIR